MTLALNILLPALAALAMLGAFYYAVKGVGSRSRSHREKYNVGQVEVKRAGQVSLVRALTLFIVGLIFLGLFAMRPLISRAVTSVMPAPTPTVDMVATQEAAATPITPTVEPTIEITPTDPPASPSPEVTVEPTATSTPVTAVVSSGVGVWLRGAPSTTGEQLEWLLDGAVVTVLGAQETADDLVWQQVRTEAGDEGWVASDFLTLNEPEP